MAKRIDVKNNVLKRGKHYVTCDWGYYSDGRTWHKGIDLIGDAVKSDTSIDDIVAFADGVVIEMVNTIAGYVGSTKTDGCGNYVSLKHENGWVTRYMHMVKGSVTVKVGQRVKKGQVLGHMGATGNATGNHLHFDISNSSFLPYGRKINGRYYADPKPFLSGKMTFADVGYQTGTYQVIKDVNVRDAPSLDGTQLTYYSFTDNARKQIRQITPNKPNYFPAGMRVTISQVSGNWGKCPSGWLSLNFCKKV